MTFRYIRRTIHAGHCWRSWDELTSDVLLCTPTHGRAKVGRPAGTYIQQLCEDTGCCPEDLPEAMNDREKWRERVRDIRATSTTWWWWWGWLVRFYGILNFVGYLMPNPFLHKWTVLFQIIQFSISTQFNCQKPSYFKLFSLVKRFNFKQFSLPLVRSLNVSTHFNCQKHFYFERISLVKQF